MACVTCICNFLDAIDPSGFSWKIMAVVDPTSDQFNQRLVQDGNLRIRIVVSKCLSIAGQEFTDLFNNLIVIWNKG